MRLIKTGGRRSVLIDGLIVVWPICLGYAPIGLAFGVLAQKAGLDALHIGIMSLLVFAGSAQFIAVSMLSGGAGAASIVLATFLVNLRHLLMSSSLAVRMPRMRPGKAAFFAYGVTDESFALNTLHFQKGGWDADRALVVNQTANFVWLVMTVLGGYIGPLIPAGAAGIDYALIAMFICLLVFQLKNRLVLVTAGIAGASAVLLALLIPGNAYIVLASVFAATAGVMLKRFVQ